MNENIILNEGERIDKVNDNIFLIQKNNGLTFGTDAYLLSAYINSSFKTGCELGSGTGIISLLLLQKNKLNRIYAYEIQDDFAKLTQRNAQLNGFDNRLTVLSKDVKSASVEETGGEVDIVFSNPPYMKANSGINSKDVQMNIARREISGNIFDFCLSAASLLKWGGRFYCVYRPDRLSTLIYSMKEAKLEPKRLTFVHPDADCPPSLVLVEARYGGGEELKVTRPLVIYNDKTHKQYTDDLQYIYATGNFPEKRF